MELVSQKPLVLLVEDNPDDEELTMIALSASEVAHKSVITRNGEAALDYLFARGPYQGRGDKDTPQLILLDLKLPKVDGLEVLRQIRAHAATQSIPIVVLTTSNEEQDLFNSYRYGANSYIRKSVDFTRFADSIKQITRYWLVLNKAPRLTSILARSD